MVGSGPLMPGPGTSAPGTCVLRTSLPSFTPVCSRGWSSCGKNPLTQEKPRERSEECVSGSGEDWWRPVVTSRDPQRTTTPGELRRCGSPCAGLRGRGAGEGGRGLPLLLRARVLSPVLTPHAPHWSAWCSAWTPPPPPQPTGCTRTAGGRQLWPGPPPTANKNPGLNLSSFCSSSPTHTPQCPVGFLCPPPSPGFQNCSPGPAGGARDGCGESQTWRKRKGWGAGGSGWGSAWRGGGRRPDLSGCACTCVLAQTVL